MSAVCLLTDEASCAQIPPTDVSKPHERVAGRVDVLYMQATDIEMFTEALQDIISRSSSIYIIRRS